MGTSTLLSTQNQHCDQQSVCQAFELYGGSSERLTADDGDDDVPKNILFKWILIVSTLIIILLLLY